MQDYGDDREHSEIHGASNVATDTWDLSESLMYFAYVSSISYLYPGVFKGWIKYSVPISTDFVNLIG
jgi:hypothetical protein